MDLVYTKIYRLFEIGSFLIPHNPKDLNRLDDVFDTMVKLNVMSVSLSYTKCIMAFFFFFLLNHFFLKLGINGC